MDGKVGEDLPGEPEFGNAGVVEGGVAGGHGRGDVLVLTAHDDDGERGVEQVVTPHKDGVEYALDRYGDVASDRLVVQDKDKCLMLRSHEINLSHYPDVI